MSIIEQRIGDAIDTLEEGARQIRLFLRRSWWALLGFFAAYVLFVYVNGQFFSECGGWNDLEWLGRPALRGTPSVSFAFGVLCDPSDWLIFNVVDIAVGWFCEWRILACWAERKRRVNS